MDGNQNTCKKCGASLPAGATFCAACGSTVAPVAPQQPAAPSYGAAAPQQPAAPSYGAAAPQQPAAPSYGVAAPQQPAAPSYGAAAPQQPAAPNYGAAAPQQPAAPSYGATVPQQPSAAGYGVPVQQQPGSIGYPGQYGATPGGYGSVPGAPGVPGYPTQAPAPKKKSPVIAIVAVVVALAIIASIVFIVWNNQKNAAIQAEYDALVESICASTSTSRVASQESSLRNFQSTYPDFEVEGDLQALMNACVEYEDAAESETRYEDMMGELDSLTDSSNDKIADCADRLYDSVEAEHSVYLASLEAPDPDGDGEGDSDGDGERGLSYTTYAGFSSGLYVFDVINESDKTVVYFEVVVFAYDAEGNRVNPDSRSWEFSFSDIGDAGKQLAPGEELKVVASVQYCSGAYFGIPYFNYIEYSDGTTEGTKADLESDSFLSNIETQNLIYDILALIVAPRLASQPLYSEAVRKKSYLAA